MIEIITIIYSLDIVFAGDVLPNTNTSKEKKENLKIAYQWQIIK